MGLKYYDLWSLGHFVMGIISYLILKKADFKTTENFVISNGLHLLVEFIERSQVNGKILESFSNHVGDVIFFLLGWIISMKVKSENGINGLFIPYLFALVLFTFLKEVFQELYPEYKKPINYTWYYSLLLLTIGIFVLRPPLLPS
jgi:hypothetical protein